jgi:vitamin B12 transporter
VPAVGRIENEEPMKLSLMPVAAALACAAMASHAPPSLAQTEPQVLAPTVVTAARVEQSLADALPDTSVITRADIERSQAPDLLTLLQRLPGVEVAQAGGLGSQTGLFVRGAETRQVLVLIDGVPLNNVNFSTASLDQIMAAQVERVEVVRGNVGSLYGSQAAGGVINVFTRGGVDGVAANAVFGSRSSYQALGTAGASGGPWQYGITLSANGTHGFNAINQAERPGTNPDLDGYRNTSASANLAYHWADDQSLSLKALHSRGRLQYDSEFGPATQADESAQTIDSVSAVLRNRLAPTWNSRLSVGYLLDSLDASVTAYPYFVRSTSEQIAWQNDIDLAAGWTATAAAEHLNQKIDSDTAYNTDHRTVNSLRAGVLGKAGPHQLQANLRYDRYSDFGNASTGYLGYGYALTPVLKLVASASTGFNAPTFNDLFYPYGGNPDLKPERSRSAEAGLQYADGAVSGRLQLFGSRYRDLIGFDSAYNRVNVGEASVRGAEASLEVPLGDWRASLAATYQDALNETDHTRLNRRARQFGNLQLARSLGAFDVQANLRATGDRRDTAGGIEHMLPGYALLDIAARWRAGKEMQLTLRAENLFDRSYENAWGYRGTPRGLFGGIEVRL